MDRQPLPLCQSPVPIEPSCCGGKLRFYPVYNIHYSPTLKKWGLYWICLVLPDSVVLSFCQNFSDETWISLRPVCQSWSNFIWSIIRVGERLHKVLEQIGSNLWFPWPQKAPNGENDVSTFSLLFLIRSFSNLKVTRTGIKSGRVQISARLDQS